jgi:hypothetical protein
VQLSTYRGSVSRAEIDNFDASAETLSDSGYIVYPSPRLYEGDTKLLTDSLAQIQKAATQILKGIGGETLRLGIETSPDFKELKPRLKPEKRNSRGLKELPSRQQHS